MASILSKSEFGFLVAERQFEAEAVGIPCSLLAFKLTPGEDHRHSALSFSHVLAHHTSEDELAGWLDRAEAGVLLDGTPEDLIPQRAQRICSEACRAGVGCTYSVWTFGGRSGQTACLA